MTVPDESAISAGVARGSRPSRRKPPCSPIAISVPMASKTAMNRKMTTTGIMATSSRPRRSSCRNVGASDGGRSTRPW